jgi:hypothetical protein
VGVGDGNFASMSVLDADCVSLRYNRKTMKRDILNFVPLNQHNQSSLASALLQEIPKQFDSYYRMRQIKPNPPVIMALEKAE